MDVHADDAEGLEAALLDERGEQHVLPGQRGRVHQTKTPLDPVRLRQLLPRLPQPAATDAQQRLLLLHVRAVPGAALHHRHLLAGHHCRYADGECQQ